MEGCPPQQSGTTLQGRAVGISNKWSGVKLPRNVVRVSLGNGALQRGAITEYRRFLTRAVRSALHLFVAKIGRRVPAGALAAIGPFWDGNEARLLAGGGVLFLAFPRGLGSGLSGFYLALFLVLWVLSSCAGSRSSSAPPCRRSHVAVVLGWRLRIRLDSRRNPYRARYGRHGPASPSVRAHHGSRQQALAISRVLDHLRLIVPVGVRRICASPL